MPRAGVTGRWRPVGSEGESKAEEGASDVSQDQLCVSLGIQGFFFQWKDCLPEQLGAGRAWTGGDGGGLSRRVSRGAREALSQAVALKVQRKGGGNPAQQASPRQSWGGRAARLPCLVHWWLPVLVEGYLRRALRGGVLRCEGPLDFTGEGVLCHWKF